MVFKAPWVFLKCPEGLEPLDEAHYPDVQRKTKEQKTFLWTGGRLPLAHCQVYQSQNAGSHSKAKLGSI